MKIALIGYGKMGKMIEELIQQGSKHQVVLKISSSNLSDLTKENLKKADVAIEYTNPDSVIKNIKLCVDASVPIVVGTTGWTQHKKEVKNYCLQNNGTVLYASNFSIGVNLFFALNKKLAELMKNQPQYEVAMEEIHHTAKKDSPSGTGISLANDILGISPVKKKWVEGKSQQKDELSIDSKRIENVVGTHIVTYSSVEDEIEIKHTAHSRKGFAAGSILAAEGILNKKGFFTFSEILNLQ